MFTIKKLLHLLEKENHSWKNPTAMTKTILMVLTDYHYPSDIASKVFSGVNQGRNIYKDITDIISEETIDTYLSKVETGLRNQNFRNSNFESLKMVEATYRLLKDSTNLNQDIYQGLLQSYAKNKDNRPYLFLAECFYYALASRHDKTIGYKTTTIPVIQNPPTLSAWGDELEEATLNEILPPKFWATTGQMTIKEITIFKSLAKLVVIDEDGEYYLYAPVTNEEVELYKDFGIGNSEFLLMEEFGLINIGARVVNTISVKSDPAGFQNDSLVFAFTTKSKPFDIHFNSYSFTTVGLKLLEILEVKTDNDFFRKLCQLFVQQHVYLPIDFYLTPVEVMEDAENMEELEEYRLR